METAVASHPEAVSCAAHPAPRKFALDFNPEAVDLLRSCVHCGLCLGSCPTYRETGDENDSPRGRLYLMKGLSEGRLKPTPEVTGHLELCLDCRACESACPSGVHYGHILEATRETLHKAVPPGPLATLARSIVFGQLFNRHEFLKLVTYLTRFYQKSGLRKATHALGILNLFPKRLKEIEAMQPDLSEPSFRENAPLVFPALGTDKPIKRVAFFSGCVMDLFMGHIHRATVKVLQAHGVEVLNVPGQACCGALAVHAGEADAGRVLARRNLEIFNGLGVDAIVNNSAGCGAAMKEYPILLHGDPAAKEFSAKVKDVSEILAGLTPLVPLKPLNLTVCYDEPCHLLHAQKISTQPKSIIARIPGIKVVPLPESEACCGAAGIYNITQPHMSGMVLDRKIECIKTTKADIVLTGNPGCLMQIRGGCQKAGLSCEVIHPMELFARAIV